MKDKLYILFVSKVKVTCCKSASVMTVYISSLHHFQSKTYSIMFDLRRVSRPFEAYHSTKRKFLCPMKTCKTT